MPPTVTQLAFRNPRRAEIDSLVGREDELEPSAVLSDGSSELFGKSSSIFPDRRYRQVSVDALPAPTGAEELCH